MDSLLLTDSTMPVSFCRAGVGCARAMAEFLGDSVQMVADVHEELERLGGELPALRSLLSEWPPNPIRELDLDLKAEVAAALKARHVPGTHRDEDRGETATVFYAVKRRDIGEAFRIVTDDSYGKRLARDRDFELLTTPVIALRMVCAEALSQADGKRVWRQSTNRSQWAAFDAALARERASA